MCQHQFRRLTGALFMLMSVWCISPPASASCIGLGCSCSVSATDLAFGIYDPFSASNSDSVGNIEVSCGAFVLGATISYEIRLSTGSSGTYAARTLTSGGSSIAYNLYTDAGRSQVWGDASGSTNSVSDGYLLSLIKNRSEDYSVYGRIPGSQNVPAGSYTDSIVVTVIF